MNYNYLLYFSVLAQTEHYTTAAARLGISQPALSSAIHNLENALGGVKLFEKNGRNIRLTEEGHFYRQTVDESIKKLQNASAILRNSKTQAPVVIRIGAVSGALSGALAQLIVKYTHNNSRLRFQLTEGAAENLMDLVRQEKLDMAIVDVSDRDRSLHFRKLYQRTLYVAMPREHPLARQQLIEPQDVLTQPQVAYNHNVDKSFQQWAAGMPAEETVVCTVNTVSAALDLVEEGIGIAFVPGESLQVRPGLRFVPLRNWHQALYMCILYDKWLEPPVWDFVEQTVKVLRHARNSENWEET